MAAALAFALSGSGLTAQRAGPGVALAGMPDPR